MAPRYLVDAERSFRAPEVQDQFRFWLAFRLGAYVYKRWFASEAERSYYQHHQIPHAEIVNHGEVETRTPHAD